MAKFVIAGCSNCPYFAKLELLADQLAVNLPQFQVFKIVKSEEDWPKWLKELCDQNKWNHSKSPIVWRELVDRGGKGLLIGGLNDFLEYAQCYYGVTSNIMTGLMLKMRDENQKTTTDREEEKKYYESLSKPINVCVTNASSPTAYNLVASIASGEIFGNNTEISLSLLGNHENLEIMKGVQMEMTDLAYPLLRQISVTSDPEEAFKNTTAVFILDELPYNDEKDQSDSREEWLKRNAKLFEKYAEILNDHALTEVKVIVAGKGPVNFNTHVLIENATNISKQNIIAASRLQERRMRAALAKKLGVNSVGVKDAIVWGDCSYDGAQRMYADVAIARCHGYDGAIWGPDWFSRRVIEMVYDNMWLTENFIDDLETHHETLSGQLQHETSLSSAAALSSLMRDWFHGTGEDEIYSLGVKCEGWYGIKNCVFSLPVKFSTPGSYQVIWDLEIDEETKIKLASLETELIKDIQTVYPDKEADEAKIFGENADLTTAPVPSGSPVKTPGGDKLEIIQEENEVSHEGEKEKQDAEVDEGEEEGKAKEDKEEEKEESSQQDDAVEEPKENE